MNSEVPPENTKIGICYLRSLQSILLQHNSLLNECKQFNGSVDNNNKETLIKEIEDQNKACYKHQLALLSTYRSYGPSIGPLVTPRRTLFCTNEKDYLGTLHSWIMRILQELRDNPKIFEYFISSIDKLSKPSNASFSLSTLDNFADDLIFMFFADFSSMEKNVTNLLRHFQVILVKIIKSYAAGDCLMLFEDQNLMVNRLIKSFLNTNNNRDYLSLLFGKLFDEATDLKKYAKRMREKMLQKNKTNPFTKEKAQTTDTIPTTEEQKEGKLNDTLLICEGIINRATKKLLHMPLAMRYFFKLLANIAFEHVITLIIVGATKTYPKESYNGYTIY